MKKILNVIRVIYCLYALLWFIALMFIVLVFALVFALFGKVRGGNLVYIACKCWAIAWYFVTGIRHKEVYEAPHDKTRQYIFVANHISYMDIPCIVRSVHQRVRILGKYEMVKYPVFGLIYRMVVVLVDRSSPERRAQSVRALKSALKKHISIFIFPEGTFNETGKPLKSFYDGAFRIAIETQTPIKPMLFIDTLKRMHYKNIWQLTPGVCRTIYLDEIKVDGYTMQDLPALKQKVYSVMEAGLLRWQ